MKTYRVTIKYAEDILDYEWGFNAENQEDADRKIDSWNRYHGKANCPGYRYAVAVETEKPVYLHNEYLR